MSKRSTLRPRLITGTPIKPPLTEPPLTAPTMTEPTLMEQTPMELPPNLFKRRLAAGAAQIGAWNAMPGAIAAEVLAIAGFDWIVVDTEHAPTEVADVLPALQIIAGYPEAAAVVRPAINDPVLIKRHLDQGAQTLLLPYVQTPEEAADGVAAMRYPPRGVRGAAGATRATRYGAVAGYAAQVDRELCLIVQVETVEAMAQLEAIAGVEGVDAVFIGPADLAASMGLPGQPDHPDVLAAVEDALGRLNAIGAPGGVLSTNLESCRRFVAAGALFTAVCLDAALLASAARGARDAFR